MTNYYLTLDIMPGSSQNDILHAYNRAKMTYSSGSLASYSLLEETNNDSIIHEIERAFEILGSPSKRREYDLAMGFDTWTEDEKSGRNPNPAPTVTASSKISGKIAGHQEGLSADDFDDPLASPPSEFREKAAELRHGRSTAMDKHARVNEAAVASEFEPNGEFEQKIRAVTELDGAFVRAVRVYRNLSVEQLANMSKIAPGRISAVEDEDTSEHNQTVYLRGHVAIICRALELPNPENLAKTYIARLRSQGKLPADRI